MKSEEFHDLLQKKLKQEPPAVINGLIYFRELVLKENENQNLTRLTSPKDFFEGHLLDVLELNPLLELKFPALDLGSGAGVPGLLSAILKKRHWILCDSEIKKAEFLKKAIQKLSIQDVEVFAGRGEDFLKKHTVETVVSRAVGSVQKIYSWIRKCSTWNILILFKGPNWEKEWQEFQSCAWRKELKLMRCHEYFVGDEKKRRRIVCLKRI